MCTETACHSKQLSQMNETSFRYNFLKKKNLQKCRLKSIQTQATVHLHNVSAQLRVGKNRIHQIYSEWEVKQVFLYTNATGNLIEVPKIKEYSQRMWVMNISFVYLSLTFFPYYIKVIATRNILFFETWNIIILD